MELEQQVTSLELSKRLKELGVKQESYFQWRCAENDVGTLTWWIEVGQGDYQYPNAISAYTTSELGEKMLKRIKIHVYRDTSGKWWVNMPKSEIAKDGLMFSGDTEAEARGLMLEYLIKNKLITL